MFGLIKKNVFNSKLVWNIFQSLSSEKKNSLNKFNIHGEANPRINSREKYNICTITVANDFYLPNQKFKNPTNSNQMDTKFSNKFCYN